MPGDHDLVAGHDGHRIDLVIAGPAKRLQRLQLARGIEAGQEHVPLTHAGRRPLTEGRVALEVAHHVDVVTVDRHAGHPSGRLRPDHDIGESRGHDQAAVQVEGAGLVSAAALGPAAEVPGQAGDGLQDQPAGLGKLRGATARAGDRSVVRFDSPVPLDEHFQPMGQGGVCRSDVAGIRGGGQIGGQVGHHPGVRCAASIRARRSAGFPGCHRRRSIDRAVRSAVQPPRRARPRVGTGAGDRQQQQRPAGEATRALRARQPDHVRRPAQIRSIWRERDGGSMPSRGFL